MNRSEPTIPLDLYDELVEYRRRRTSWQLVTGNDGPARAALLAIGEAAGALRWRARMLRIGDDGLQALENGRMASALMRVADHFNDGRADCDQASRVFDCSLDHLCPHRRNDEVATALVDAAAGLRLFACCADPRDPVFNPGGLEHLAGELARSAARHAYAADKSRPAGRPLSDREER